MTLTFDEEDAEEFTELYLKKDATPKQRDKMIRILQKVARNISESGKQDKDRPRIIRKDIRAFIRCYEFLTQVTCLDDRMLHKTYLFLSCLKTMLGGEKPEESVNITDKIKAENFVQKRKEEHKNTTITSNPNVNLSNAEKANLAPEKKAKLSEIIAEINNRTGKMFDEDVAYAAIIQIKELLKKDEDLRRSAVTNPLEDFAFTYDDKIDDVLLDGLEQNKEFYSLLLNNKEIKHEFLDLFLSDVYESYNKDKKV